MAVWYHVSSKDTGTAILMAGGGRRPAMRSRDTVLQEVSNQ